MHKCKCIELKLLCCANSLCYSLFPLCSGLFLSGCANFVCVVACFHSFVLISLCCDLFALFCVNFVVLL